MPEPAIVRSSGKAERSQVPWGVALHRLLESLPLIRIEASDKLVVSPSDALSNLRHHLFPKLSHLALRPPNELAQVFLLTLCQVEHSLQPANVPLCPEIDQLTGLLDVVCVEGMGPDHSREHARQKEKEDHTHCRQSLHGASSIG